MIQFLHVANWDKFGTVLYLLRGRPAFFTHEIKSHNFSTPLPSMYEMIEGTFSVGME